MGKHFAFEEEALPSKLNLAVWGKIGKYALKKWPMLLLILLCTVFTAYYDSSFVPMMNKAAIVASSTYTGYGDVWAVTLDVDFIFGLHWYGMSFATYLTILVVMILVRSLTIFLNFFLTNYVSMEIMTSLRRDTFKKIQELSFSYFDRTSSGWLIARMQNDTSSIGDVLSWSLTSIFWAILDIFFTIVTMFSANWLFALVVLASVPVVAIIVPIFESKILKAHRSARNAQSFYVGWLAEAIAGAKTIKTMAIEEEIASEADEITDEIRGKRLKAERINAYFQPLLSLISYFMIAVILWFGMSNYGASWMNMDQIQLAATLVLFVSFVQSIYDPLQQLAEIFSEFMAAQAGAEKVMQLLEAKPEIVDRPEVIEKYGTLFENKSENFEPLKGEIVFKDVKFDYGNGIEVIHPLNLKIKEGTSLAIVGETGSGKTTMVNLLCRFYEPTGGHILIDGVDYLDRSLGYLHSNIGYVQQSPFVFSCSYKDNIRYGRRDASDEEIVEAAKMVGIHDFIMSQPEGYDTFLHDGGNQLSQGQKQLISFARAIIRNPAILILDEATSSIDTETEAEVQKAISVLLKNRTSIVIAHRLSTIVGSDRILVMDHGTIIEDGDHKTLMELKGAYYKLYMSQFKDLSIGEQLETYATQIEAKNVKI